MSPALLAAAVALVGPGGPPCPPEVAYRPFDPGRFPPAFRAGWADGWRFLPGLEIRPRAALCEHYTALAGVSEKNFGILVGLFGRAATISRAAQPLHSLGR